ncbi:5-oxoprolinase subunit PxpB [Adhaeribacter aquaticus]|uniref:5-oxoprolinase subunit PxpB n=1 Tax=Adhaeribacter aquaticus TaxID=299567 RepID=UPI0003F6EC95|nr:5-oxoprolinase subunit PxpB [Adhaeribacter aquaticus]
MPTSNVRLYPLGDTAIVVQFGDTIKRNTHYDIQAFGALLAQNPFQGFIEYVPAFTTLTIYYNPFIVSQQGLIDPYHKVAGIVNELLQQVNQVNSVPSFRLVEIPVCYGGSYGPDLELVAELNQLSPEEVITIHTTGDYLVYMLGFAPGFPYLGGMSEKIATPRKSKPRAKVWAGSVGIAGKQTGIYSLATPGGWQIIGRTPLQLFNYHRNTPCLLQPGDHIKFIPISEKEFESKKEGRNGA